MDLGRAAYGPVLELQRRLVQRVREAPAEKAFLLLVEHDPPVITLGRGSRQEHLLASPEQLAEEGIEVHEASRGGDVTYHGPGQLVAYPIIRLDLHGRDIRGYLRRLEAAVIHLLKGFGVSSRRDEQYTGVWAGQEKIAAIGVAVRRWVTYHGLALNVDSNLRHFGLIVPCGIRGKGVTSLSRVLGRNVHVGEVKQPLVECLAAELGFQKVQELPPE